MIEWGRTGKEMEGEERGGGGRESSIQLQKGPKIQKAEEWQAQEWNLLREMRRRETERWTEGGGGGSNPEFSFRYFITVAFVGRWEYGSSPAYMLTVQGDT